jgi:uroporphyrinogen-III decarboxylase
MEKKWEEMAREEKRDFRLKRWLEAEHVEFPTPEARQMAKERATRLMKVYLVEEPDRVPVSLPAGNYPAYYAGGSLYKVMYDYDELRRAWIKFLHDFASDMDTFRGPGVNSGRVLDILDYKISRWPGKGVGKDVSSHQFVEGEYMMADEYDELMKDPSDFVFRKLFPRQIGAFEAFNKFSSFASVMGWPVRFVSAAMNPDVRKALQALIDAGAEMAKWQKAVIECSREGLAMGFPATGGGMAMAPFDSIGDVLRGTHGVMLDMYRQPDKLHEAMDKVADITIESALAGVNATRGISVGFPLHKGDDTFMSDKQFEEFYWPSLKKVILALIDEGVMVFCFAEGRYERRLDAISELPKGWTHWLFDQTDMANVKRVIGDVACISGNVPTSLVATGTPEEVKEACRKLIETCAPGGGYILSGGASVSETNPENLRMFMAAAKEYGMYK